MNEEPRQFGLDLVMPINSSRGYNPAIREYCYLTPQDELKAAKKYYAEQLNEYKQLKFFVKAGLLATVYIGAKILQNMVMSSFGEGSGLEVLLNPELIDNGIAYSFAIVGVGSGLSLLARKSEVREAKMDLERVQQLVLKYDKYKTR
nr:hypothetical protein [Nanoarchaeota archaeon]